MNSMQMNMILKITFIHVHEITGRSFLCLNIAVNTNTTQKLKLKRVSYSI